MAFIVKAEQCIADNNRQGNAPFCLDREAKHRFTKSLTNMVDIYNNPPFCRSIKIETGR